MRNHFVEHLLPSLHNWATLKHHDRSLNAGGHQLIEILEVVRALSVEA